MVSVIFLSPLLSAVAVFLQNFLLGGKSASYHKSCRFTAISKLQLSNERFYDFFLARKENLEGEEVRLLSGMFELCFAMNEECDSGLCKNDKEGDKLVVLRFVLVPHTFLTAVEYFFRKLSFAVTKGVPRTELISIMEVDRMVDMSSYSTAATRRYTNDECVELVIVFV